MRSLDSAIASASASPVVRFLYLVRIDFDSGTVAWHSGFGNYVYDGITYLGVNILCGISSVSEEAGIKSNTVTLTISGIKPEVISLALQEKYINRTCRIYLQCLDDQDRPITATPYLLFRGSLDNIEGTQGASASFKLTVKSRLADWERPRKLRFTDSDQQKLYPGDKGCEYIPQLSERVLIWPRAAFLPDPRD